MLATGHFDVGNGLRKLSLGLVISGAALIALLAPMRAFAQAIDLPAILAPEGGKDTWVFSSFAHQFESHLNDGGDVSRESVTLGGGRRFAFNDDWSLITSLAYQGSYYDFSSAAHPFAWDDIHQITGLVLADWKMDERWSLQGGGILRTAAEGGGDFGDAVTVGGLVGFSYRSSDSLSMGALVGVISQIENPAAILPIPQIDWRFADQWKLHMGLTNLGYTGIGPELSYAPSEAWEFAVGASYQNRRYRLAHHAGFSDGVGQETSAPIFARVRWRPQPQFMLDLFGGVAVAGQVRLEAQSGNKLQTSGYDAAPILGLRGQFVF